MKRQTRTTQLLGLMRVVAWVVYIGLMVEAGAVLFAFVFSWRHPERADNLYKGLDIPGLRQYSVEHYLLSGFFLLLLPVLKSWVAFMVIKTLSKFSIREPFTHEVAGRLEIISYFAFAIWIVTVFSNAHTQWLLDKTGKLYGNELSGDFIFAVGLLFVVSQVFRRGVEIQSENELTV